MTTLITGANGAFGRVLCDWLRKHNSDPLFATSRLNSKPFLGCDITDRNAVQGLLQRVRPTLIYHLAGSFSNQYDTDYMVNVVAARNVLEAVLEQRLNVRIVVMGSAAEYGMVAPEENPISEERMLNPVSVYGLTKAMQTMLARYYAFRYGMDVVIARMFNLIAPGLSERLFVGRLERLVESYASGAIKTIDLGNLANQRDYVSAEDAAKQLSLIALRGDRGGIYHVASGKPTAMRDILRRMLDEAGIPFDCVREKIAVRSHGDYDPALVYADMGRTHALATKTD